MVDPAERMQELEDRVRMLECYVDGMNALLKSVLEVAAKIKVASDTFNENRQEGNLGVAEYYANYLNGRYK